MNEVELFTKLALLTTAIVGLIKELVKLSEVFLQKRKEPPSAKD